MAAPAQTAEQLLSGSPFKPSDNDYDWLGPGIYFWQENPMRALEYAREKKRRDKRTWTESVVGAAIDLGLCLDLASEAGVVVVKEAFALYKDSMREVGAQLPSNRGGPDRLVRQLDCAVMRHAHSIRRRAALEPIDTVRGIFVEGGPAYPGSGFHAKTHVQICVCNPGVIKGVFRVLDLLPP